jgi:hypothetical protein
MHLPATYHTHLSGQLIWAHTVYSPAGFPHSYLRLACGLHIPSPMQRARLIVCDVCVCVLVCTCVYARLCVCAVYLRVSQAS